MINFDEKNPTNWNNEFSVQYGTVENCDFEIDKSGEITFEKESCSGEFVKFEITIEEMKSIISKFESWKK